MRELKADTLSLNYVKDNNIYIFGEFDETILYYVIPEIPNMIDNLKDKSEKEINIFINSRGGDTDVLFSLITALNSAKQNGIKIITTNMCNAYSCASKLLIFGDYVKMSKYGQVLIHNPKSTTYQETQLQADRTYKWVTDLNKMVKKFILDNSKIKEKDLDEFLKDDYCFLNAEECLKYGLINEII